MVPPLTSPRMRPSAPTRIAIPPLPSPPSPIKNFSPIHPVTFRWQFSSPTTRTVILTGTFDNWSQSIHLPRDPHNFDEFVVTLQLDRTKEHVFKFVVDGEWRCSAAFGTRVDEAGCVNNVLESWTVEKCLEVEREVGFARRWGRRASVMSSGSSSGGRDSGFEDEFWVPQSA
ncbi:hypothetical protein HDV00_007969 [Rhizophlyctis rosea]|nr:hypothetical protein HDV00_007969 [Rhizophlyctis rosea]